MAAKHAIAAKYGVCVKPCFPYKSGKYLGDHLRFAAKIGDRIGDRVTAALLQEVSTGKSFFAGGASWAKTLMTLPYSQLLVDPTCTKNPGLKQAYAERRVNLASISSNLRCHLGKGEIIDGIHIITSAIECERPTTA